MDVAEPVKAEPVVLVVMGVSGSGKSTIASVLSTVLRWPYKEGDDLHPRANIEKMASGHPLNDEDRWPWLERVAEWTEGQLEQGQNGVITCSASKRAYRELVNRRGSGVIFVYLAGERGVIADRLAQRHGHFMPSSLLDSQFADLEVPGPCEPAITVDIGASPRAIAQRIIDELHLTPQGRTTP